MALCPFAIQDPGPAWKVNFGVNGGEGIICHSAEGDLEHTLARLHSTAEVSWTFTVAKDGRIYQHYDTQKQTWHARAANVRYIGAEHEGVAGEPETDEQVGADIRLIAWLGEVYGWAKFSRTTNLREHNEFVATACPSGRIRWDDILEGLMPHPEPVPMKDGWLKEDTFWVLYNGGVEVLRIGSGDGAFPGRISKLFGDKYLWLRTGPEELERPVGDVRAVWSEEEGD